MAKRRSKGAGCIFKRGKYYYLMIRTAGKAKLTSLKTSNREQAEEKALALEAVMGAKTKEEIALHVAQARKLVASKTLPIEASWTAYKASPARPDSSLGTLGNYERNWKAFTAWLGSAYPEIRNVGQISKTLALEYAAKLGAKEISFSTFNYHIQSLRLVCRILKDESGLEENPFTVVEMKSGVKQSRRDFAPGEVLKILNSFDDDALKILNKAEMRMLFYVLAFTGLRLADAALLKWNSVEWRRKMIVCHPVKTRQVAREVHIPMLPALAEALEDAKRIKDESGYVMPHVAGRYLRNRDGVSSDCIKVIEHCDFKERNGAEHGVDRRLYGVHSFRHFYASQCAMSGVPIALLADILGDNIQTLQRYYLHANDTAREKVLAALPSPVPAAVPVAIDTKREDLLRDIAEAMPNLDDETLAKIAKLAGLNASSGR